MEVIFYTMSFEINTESLLVFDSFGINSNVYVIFSKPIPL